MRNILEDKKGITLIPLVITIILLLILAGVSIRALGGENGLIAKTKIAKEENKKSEYKEKLSIAKTEAVAEKDGQDINLDEYDIYCLGLFDTESRFFVPETDYGRLVLKDLEVEN